MQSDWQPPPVAVVCGGAGRCSTARVGVMASDCTELNENYNKWIQTGLPFVIAKCGMSLDGRLTAPPSESQWLTSAAARRHAHKLRAQVDAILVGAETIRADNPRLTVRGQPGAKQPHRIVLSRSGKLPRAARIFTDRFADRTTVYRDTGLPALLRAIAQGSTVWWGGRIAPTRTVFAVCL